MKAILKATLLAFASGLLAFALVACGKTGQASTAASGGASGAEGQGGSREDVEAILNQAANQPFSTVTFKITTSTSTTVPDDEGVMQTQSADTATTGELDQSGDKPAMHMSYRATSTVELGRTEYELFVNSERLIAKEGDQLYVEEMDDEALYSYSQSVTSAISREEIEAMLDVAASFEISESDGETTVTITADPAKLADSQEQIGESDLPENSTIATMVISYTIGTDGHFKTVRTISSLDSEPIYHMNQTCQYSNYDATSLPEWPDLQAYILEQSGIETDENGNMYFVDEDGQTHYITEIGEDGTIYFMQ